MRVKLVSQNLISNSGNVAYSEKWNIELGNRDEIRLVAKRNPNITLGYRKKKHNASKK